MEEEKIPLIERIDYNLSLIIEGLPEGKLKEIASETKKDFAEVQDVLFKLQDILGHV